MILPSRNVIYAILSLFLLCYVATQMPIYHLYTYVKNYNRFVADMGWAPLSLQTDIEKRFSPSVIATFGFTNVAYPGEVLNADLSSLYQ